MPFGLANAPAVFQAFINDVLREMLNKCVFVYLDDILIFPQSYKDHVQHAQQVLSRLLKNVSGYSRNPCSLNRERDTA